MVDEANKIEADDGWEWASVEVMGNRCHHGRTREEELFGTKMLRIDVPKKGDVRFKVALKLQAERWVASHEG